MLACRGPPSTAPSTLVGGPAFSLFSDRLGFPHACQRRASYMDISDMHEVQTHFHEHSGHAPAFVPWLLTGCQENDATYGHTPADPPSHDVACHCSLRQTRAVVMGMPYMSVCMACFVMMTHQPNTAATFVGPPTRPIFGPHIDTQSMLAYLIANSAPQNHISGSKSHWASSRVLG